MLTVIILNPFMLTVVKLSAFMLSVMAPFADTAVEPYDGYQHSLISMDKLGLTGRKPGQNFQL